MDTATVVKALKAEPSGGGFIADAPGIPGCTIRITDSPDGPIFQSSMGHSYGQIMDMVNKALKESEVVPPPPPPEPKVSIPAATKAAPTHEDKKDGMAKGETKKTSG